MVVYRDVSITKVNLPIFLFPPCAVPKPFWTIHSELPYQLKAWYRAVPACKAGHLRRHCPGGLPVKKKHTNTKQDNQDVTGGLGYREKLQKVLSVKIKAIKMVTYKLKRKFKSRCLTCALSAGFSQSMSRASLILRPRPHNAKGIWKRITKLWNLFILSFSWEIIFSCNYLCI